jgi:NTP pyrophosphatase (non-canonical NTP hydrolase)
MDLCEYQKRARSTAIYLDTPNSRILYPALGLIGECGEVAEKIKKLIRDANWSMTKERATAIAKELGDCCWYLANICCDINVDLSLMYKMRGHSITQQFHEVPLPRLVLYLNNNTTTIAKALEQQYYDNIGCFNNRSLEIHRNLTNIIVCIEELAHRCDFTLRKICDMNIEKLTKRKMKGTLKGEGDNR